MEMTPDKRKQVKGLFEAALEKPPELRLQYLSDTCSEDDLRTEVERLLSAYEEANSSPDEPALTDLSPATKDSGAYRPRGQAVATGMALTPGMKLGPYEIQSPLGVGGMGEVYRAQDTRLNREVAIKVLPVHLSQSPDLRTRFEREAKVISGLQHPHICVLHDVGRLNGVDFLVMEYLEGETLAGRLKKGPLPLKEALKVAIAIAGALGAAHRKRIVHRDLKPGNVMLTDTGAKLLDFGIAKYERPVVADEETMTIALTGQAQVIGTLVYMSPEQLQGRAADSRSDIFTFGAVLYEMLTGHRAFKRQSYSEAIAQIEVEEPRPLSEFVRDLPDDLERIIRRCLRKRPEERYASVSEIELELNDCIRRTASPAPIAKGVRWWLWAATILVSLTIISVVAWFTRRQPVPRADIKFRQLTFNSIDNPVRSAAISPDGKYVAYTDSRGIHVKLIETGDTRSVPEPEAFNGARPWWIVVSPWFSDSARFLLNVPPPGTSLVHTSRGQSIWVASVLGGPPRKLRDDASAFGVSPDGSTIAFATWEGRNNVIIWLMGTDGENARKLYESDENHKLGDLTWFPHGQRVAYTTSDQSGIRLVTRALVGGPVTTILSQSEMSEVNDFTILAGTRLLYVSADTDSVNTCNYWSVDIDEQTGARIGDPKRLTNWSGNCMNNITATADGKKLAFVKFLPQYQLNVADMVPDGTRVSKVRPLDMTESLDIPSDWSADSHSLILKSNRDSHMGLYRQALDESTAEPLVTSPDDLYAAHVTPDGLWVVYAQAKPNDDKAPVKIMRVPITGGPSQFVLAARPLGWPGCAKPPGTLCLFSEIDEARKQYVFTSFDPLKGRGLELARIDAPNYPFFAYDFSPDGGRIAYLIAPEGPIHILSLRGQPPLQIKVTDVKNLKDVDWAGNGKGLLVKFDSSGGTVLKYVDLQGNAHVLSQQRQGEIMNGRVSPDGRHLAWAIETMNENLWIMENF